MDLVQSSFQASFNARIERLAEQEAAELRTIFRYFDTDNDGAISSSQAIRLFRVLGLDVNPSYVHDLEEVYLAEFMKIVDSHVPERIAAAAGGGADLGVTGSGAAVPPLQTATMTTLPAPVTAAGVLSVLDANAVVIDEEAVRQRNQQTWEDEWKCLDTYRRGQITIDELQFFLRSCSSSFSTQDLERFMELYSDPGLPEDSMVLTKTSFLKFRREYTARELSQSDRGLSSDDDDDSGDEGDDGGGDHATGDLTARGGGTDGNSDGIDPDASDGAADKPSGQAAVARQELARASISYVEEPVIADEGIVIDTPVNLDDEFVEDDEHNDEPSGGARASRTLHINHDDNDEES